MYAKTLAGIALAVAVALPLGSTDLYAATSTTKTAVSTTKAKAAPTSRAARNAQEIERTKQLNLQQIRR
jgi:hypothetical protein